MGEALDFYEKFNYVIEINGIRRAAFLNCSELSVELGKVELREGGRLIPHKKPGLQTFADLTLTRGATPDRDMYDWMEQTAKLSTGLGDVGETYKRELDIVQIDRNGAERRRWTIAKAFPTKFSAGEWDATSEEAVVETVVLTFDSFKLS